MKPRDKRTRHEPEHRVNERIRAPKVRIVGETGSQVLPTKEAISLARSQGVDLIEISPNAEPPVCKLMEYGKFLYEKEKAKKAQAQLPKDKTKEIGLHYNVGEHDLQTKLRHAAEFLEKRCHVLFRLKFRGRENAHKDMGAELLQRISRALSDKGNPEPARANGNIMLLRVCPRH